MIKDYLIDNPDTLIKIMYSKKPDMSSVRFNKTLFLLSFHYYSFKKHYNESTEYPKHLVDINFDAWKHGPVATLQNRRRRSNLYTSEFLDSVEDFIQDTPGLEEVGEFIEDVIKQINELSDWHLIEISSGYISYKSAYEKEDGNRTIDRDTIKHESIYRNTLEDE